MPTPHIESKKEDIAPIVLMPGDPKRAEYIAKNFLEDTKLVNGVRGMNAYTGTYKGKRITIFPSGMGNPSMGIYCYELFKEYEVESIIRIGTIGAYLEDLQLGDVILVDTSISNSSYVKVQSNINDTEIPSSEYLNDIITETAIEQNIMIRKERVLCSDVFYEENSDFKEQQNTYRVAGVEMETFALFHTARMLHKKATAILTVSNSFYNSLELSSEQREKNLNNMIKLALESSLKL